MARPHRQWLETAEPTTFDLLKTLAIVEALDDLADRLVAAIIAAPDPAPASLPASFFGVAPPEPAENDWPPPGAPGGGA